MIYLLKISKVIILISIGKYHKLKVLNKRINWLVLDVLELGEAKLPVVEFDNIINIGDYVEVFLYHNSKSELIATTKKVPTMGEVAYLPVKNLTNIGAFLDWDLEKDLFGH